MDKRLSDRKKKILQAIIEAHIADGGPVGSKYLSQDKQLSCSSATIRNEMAELEALGFLEQPHTSAGRIPSELGYRFYVDALLERYRMTQGEIEVIRNSLNDKLRELDQILSDASRLASNLTNYTSIAVRPRPASVRVERYECMYVDQHNFVLVMLFPGGQIKTKYVRVDFEIHAEHLTHLSYLLNTRLVGLTSDAITISLICSLEREAGAAAPLISPVVKSVYETMSEIDGGDVRVQGVNRLLEYPEYADVDRMKDMLGMFEKKDALLDLVADANDDDVHIYIGSENTVDVMSNSALVFKQIRKEGRVVGAIGVIGPRRMNYSKVIETINQLALGIDDALGEGGNRLQGDKE
ncbi:MAG: heat-inducible transcription repressor HrcA [Clostridia bacterium]|nr:heat-inducible transcription repressor HrcA [Clostridia bacterium]